MPNKVRFPLDHFAIVARNLAEGAEFIQNHLGIEMPMGGKHASMGTHNLLLSLGEDCYMEVIAIDPEATRPPHPRWFNLDQFDGPPKLSTWIIRTDHMEDALHYAHDDTGMATILSRDDLQWLITINETGIMPMDGFFPSFIDWLDTPHPAGRMMDLGIRLSKFVIIHPNASVIIDKIGNHIDPKVVEIRYGETASQEAVFDTPNGPKSILS